jgi:hypothetical protein
MSPMLPGIWMPSNDVLKNSRKNSKKLNLKGFALSVEPHSNQPQTNAREQPAPQRYLGRTDRLHQKIESHFMLVRKPPFAGLRSDWWGYEITIPKSKMEGLKGAKVISAPQM